MERPIISAVTYSTTEARITILGVPDQLGAAGRIFMALASANINVDMIVQNEPSSAKGQAEISFTVPRDDLDAACTALQPLEGGSFGELRASSQMASVSIVGAGFRSHPEVSAQVFSVLAKEGINIEMISTSPIKISCVVARGAVEKAADALCRSFSLDVKDIKEENTFGEAMTL
jgi:aspartate kinase